MNCTCGYYNLFCPQNMTEKDEEYVQKAAAVWRVDPVTGKPIPPSQEEQIEEEAEDFEDEEEEEEEEDEEELTVPLTITILVFLSEFFSPSYSALRLRFSYPETVRFNIFSTPLVTEHLPSMDAHTYILT